MSRSVIEFEAITVVLRGRQVLGPLSWRVRHGEHWALLGPNGAGKTTLLSVAGAERHPSSGTAEVLAERLGRTDVRELRRRIGALGHRVADRIPGQVSALEVVLTGRDGLLAPWWGRFEERDRVQGRALLARLRCGELADQPFATCSQGERQRILLLARSLFGEHALLLLDEPAVGMDLPGREALVAALDELATAPEAPATIQVAHTLEELPGSISHALLLRAGRTIACGPASEVLDDESLSACYGIEVRVRRLGERFAATAAGSW